MLDDLDPTVRTLLSKILAAIYESGLVEEIDLRSILRIFDVPEEMLDNDNIDWVVKFDSAAFLDDYNAFKVEEFNQQEELAKHQNENEDFPEFGDMPSGTKLYLH